MITIENYQTRFPNNNSEYFNKLNISEREEYLGLFEKYHKLTLKYLLKKIPLLDYDKTLENNENKFIKVEKENMDMYQYLCSDDLDYFYLRNNLYIERLTSEEYEYLKNIDSNSEEDEFIEKTLQKVITELPDRKVSLCFGSDNLKYFKPNGSLIIGIRYDEFSDKIPDDENWFDTYTSIKEELEWILDAFSFSYKSLNGMPIEVVSYNEYTTVKMKEDASYNDDTDTKAYEEKEVSDNNVAQIPKEENENNIIFY